MLHIAQETKKVVKELHTLKPAYNGLVLFYFALWAGAAWLALSVQTYWLKVPLFALAGTAIHALLVLMHDTIHGTFMPRGRRWTSWTNRFIGFLCAAPSLLSASAYGVVHLSHHRHERDAEDPDEIENASDNPFILRIVLLVTFLIGSYLYILIVPVRGFLLAKPKVRVRIAIEYALIASAVAATFLFVPFSIVLHVWLLPLLFTAQINQIRGVAEHICTPGTDRITSTRTVTSHPLIGFLLCNINFHSVHHLYPGVPWYNLPRLHRLLASELHDANASIYTSYTRYLWDFAKALFGLPTPPSPHLEKTEEPARCHPRMPPLYQDHEPTPCSESTLQTS